MRARQIPKGFGKPLTAAASMVMLAAVESRRLDTAISEEEFWAMTPEERREYIEAARQFVEAAERLSPSSSQSRAILERLIAEDAALIAAGA
mgnify:CR=1 FL=1